MLIRSNIIKITLIAGLFLLAFKTGSSLPTQSKSVAKPYLGAYYFGGWTLNDKDLLTNKLAVDFGDRKPGWGWITTKRSVMDQQIKLAANAGLSFFSFCWYKAKDNSAKHKALNNDLAKYLSSPYKKRLKFNLMVANHSPFIIGSDNWDAVTDAWIKLFKDKQYLKVNNKPMIIFFSAQTLIDGFGSTQKVADAFDDFRQKAKENGLAGVKIAVNIPPNKDQIQTAESMGFDLFTGYNYHEVGFKPSPADPNSKEFEQLDIPVSNLINSDTLAWNAITRLTKLSYMPPVTLNWDPRPWANANNSYEKKHYYVGYSATSVYNSVVNLKRWMTRHSDKITAANIAILYAWNEYGEGAWLTPTSKFNPLTGLKKALSN